MEKKQRGHKPNFLLCSQPRHTLKGKSGSSKTHVQYEKRPRLRTKSLGARPIASSESLARRAIEAFRTRKNSSTKLEANQCLEAFHSKHFKKSTECWCDLNETMICLLVFFHVEFHAVLGIETGLLVAAENSGR